MIKVKHARTADCVVAGFRWHKTATATLVGSLLLGLYDDDGRLHHVGVTSSFTHGEAQGARRRARAAARRTRSTITRGGNGPRPAAATTRMPGRSGSRWSAGKDTLSPGPLRIERVMRRCQVRPPAPGRPRFPPRDNDVSPRSSDPDKAASDCRYDLISWRVGEGVTRWTRVFSIT